MKKRLVCLALGLALCLGVCPAQAVEGDTFPTVKEYPGYADVAETDWFYSNAKLCYEIGLMNGTDVGFEPYKTLTGPECAAMAARLLERLTGRPIPEPVPDPSLSWYQHYCDYLGGFVQESGSSLYGLIKWYDPEEFEQPATRYDFLVFMALVADGNWDYFPNVNEIGYGDLPDIEDDNVVLRFYNIGILTGKDKYGTFNGSGTLTRAEAAAMVSRMAKPELRVTFTPADYSPFTAAYLTPGTVMFDSGATAEEFLRWVNIYIAGEEAGALRSGHKFNWNYMDLNGKTTLENVKTAVMEALGVTERMGTQAYKDFDYQVYYSRLIDITGETLEPDYGVGVGS